jgi:hypothetical protein
MKLPPLFRTTGALALAASLAACSSLPKWSVPQWNAPAKPAASASALPGNDAEPLAPVRERPEMLMAARDDGVLITFNASSPERLIHQLPLLGLLNGEQIVSLDFDTHRPALYALSTQGRVLRIDAESGQVRSAGATIKAATAGSWSLDVDAKGQSLRVVSAEGAYWRIPLDAKSGQAGPPRAMATLSYAKGDLLQGIKPQVVALAFSPATATEPGVALAIDAAAGYLVQQGRTLTATTDDVLVDDQQLNAIGPLGIKRFDWAAMDIADTNNAAYLVTATQGVNDTRLYELKLSSGQARLIGALSQPRRITAMTIVP